MPREKFIPQIAHNIEPEYPAELRQEILETLGNIEHIEIWGQDVLVAAFVQSPYFGKPRPGQPPLRIGEKQQEEDKWQSKSFLVLQLGNDVARWCEKNARPVPQIGDWCWGNVQDADHLNLHGLNSKPWKDAHDGLTRRPWGDSWPCRLIAIADIRGRTTRPQDVM